MKFCVAAILALSAAPAHSFSYLDTLGTATAVSTSVDIAPPAPAAPAEEAPFFFTDGTTDQSADSPAFYFTSGTEDVPASTSAGYLDALGGAGSAAPAPAAPATTAGSSASYLDVLGSGATSVSGPGITSYLDALPLNSAIGGAGITSYASSLNQYASEIVASVQEAAPVAAAPVAAAPAPVAAADAASAPTATTSGSYLDALLPVPPLCLAPESLLTSSHCLSLPLYLVVPVSTPTPATLFLLLPSAGLAFLLMST
eukprot:jgi/Psemu1/3928/gm1.3928_g